MKLMEALETELRKLDNCQPWTPEVEAVKTRIIRAQLVIEKSNLESALRSQKYEQEIELRKAQAAKAEREQYNVEMEKLRGRLEDLKKRVGSLGTEKDRKIKALREQIDRLNVST